MLLFFRALVPCFSLSSFFCSYVSETGLLRVGGKEGKGTAEFEKGKKERDNPSRENQK